MTKTKILLIGALILGILLIATGFLYDVFFAGIPYQDPTPQMTDDYNTNSSISLIISGIGLLITASSSLALILTFLKK